MSQSHATIDHKKIKNWTERRDGCPATVKGTERDSEGAGLLRIDFPGYSGEDSLECVSWDEFFKKFEESDLALVYQNRTNSGELSHFSKFVSRDSVGFDGGSGEQQTKQAQKGILQILEQDHDTVKSILEKMLDTTSRAVKTREKQLQRLRQEILPHMEAEESLFYPYLLDNADEKDDVRESLEEHRVTKMWLKQVEDLAVDDDAWHARAKVLSELIHHHIDEEEDEIFEMTQELLDSDQSHEMAQNFKEKKKETEV